MSFRYPIALIAAAAITFACGPRPHASEAPRGPSARHADGAPIASSLAVKVGPELTFSLAVTNNTRKKIELMFPDGRTHDVVVLDAKGTERWRWSEGRMFTQALQNRLIDASETLTYDESWQPKLEPGTYVAVATLRSSNHPIEERATFSVR